MYTFTSICQCICRLSLLKVAHVLPRESILLYDKINEIGATVYQ